MHYRVTIILLILVVFVSQGLAQTPRDEMLFDEGWKFKLGDIEGAEKPEFSDTSWRDIDLPHDWSIEDLPKGTNSPTPEPAPTNEPPAGGGRRGRMRPNFQAVGPFSPESPGGRATGYVLGGTGWYRKHFVLDEQALGKRVVIEFDGVYMDSDVWLNGHHLGNHPYGYTAFAYDLSDFVNPPGQDNVLAVRVRNIGRNSRWYSGSGIYRHVVLRVTDPLHVDQWGVCITTGQVTKEKATVNMVTTVKNERDVKTALTLCIKLTGPAGQTLQTGETNTEVAGGGQVDIPLALEVTSPPLWSIDSPALCQAEVTLLVGGKVVDTTTTTFGIREIKFSAANGFTLNGESVLLRGACLHHDLGLLGSAAFDRAEKRRVQVMKASGYNAIRTAHNPPSTAFLDACDQLGILVIDEAFDCWEQGKNPDDYGKYFKDWWQRDLDSIILRDRNHPSVIMWSIGNEIKERAEESGYAIAKQLSEEVRRLDPTRPVNEGVCGFWDQPGRPWSDTEKAFSFLDVGGYNYQHGQYESDHKTFPDRIIVGTESYLRDIAVIWRLVEKHPYVLGDFVWTGMDYLGEAGLGAARGGSDSGTYFNAYCGDLDICGFKKASSYYRDVVWGLSPLEVFVHSQMPEGRRESVSAWGWPDELQSWNWDGHEGDTMNVRVFSRYQVIRLQLNDKVIDEQTIGENSRLIANFKVPYESGVLRAIALENGIEVTSKELKTTGAPDKIKLVADRTRIKADRNDLSYIKVAITDAQGHFVPNAAIPVTFTITGVGEIAGSGNACPYDMESFNNAVCKTFHGQALVILRPLKNKEAGEMTLRAEAYGLTAAEINITVQ
jgi:beta-galactosidase